MSRQGVELLRAPRSSREPRSAGKEEPAPIAQRCRMRLLFEHQRTPVMVTAERIGWKRVLTVLKHRVRVLRPAARAASYRLRRSSKRSTHRPRQKALVRKISDQSLLVAGAGFEPATFGL